MVVICDRCGGITHAAITYRRGQSVWSFCKHHAREHDVVLRGLGYTRQTLEAMVASG